MSQNTPQQSFQIGDTVRLKSGGPLMTVTGLNETSITHRGQIQCQWFEGNKPQNANFPAAALMEDSDDLSIEII